MNAPLSWTVTPPEAGNGKSTGSCRATADELENLSAALGVLSVEALDVHYAIELLHQARYRLIGRIDARLTQACVVTLEPVAAKISEPFNVELRPDVDAPVQTRREDQEVLAAEDVEPFDGGEIELGRIVFECLSAAIDPYPRKPDAEFDWQDPKSAGNAGPFAALAKLRRE
jgi:uncharacterized metal-binding protein YceD (DUF177 family)